MKDDLFNCGSLDVQATSTSHLLQSANNRVKLYLQRSDGSGNSTTNEIYLLQYKVTLDEQTTPEDITHYFRLAKMIISTFRNAIVSKKSIKPIDDWLRDRRQIHNFLRCLAKSIKFMNSCQEKTVIKEIHHLLSFVGRISMLEEVDPNIFIGFRDETSLSNQYFHTFLDIWWMSFQILTDHVKRTKLLVNLIVDVANPEDFYTIFLECLLCDLLYISIQLFNSINDLRTITTMTPFICNCHKEFYAIVKLAVENDNALLVIHPLWYHINLVMENVFNDGHGEPKGCESLTSIKKIPHNFVAPRYPDLAALWLMSNLMELVCFSPENSHKGQDRCNSLVFSKAITSILQQQESSNHVDTGLIEITLLLCLNTVKYCDVCVDLVLPFIDFYFKTLCQPSPNTPLINIVPKSSYQWYLKLDSLFDKGSATEWEDKTLGTLLLLLDKTISRLFTQDTHQYLASWQKLKTQLFPKLTQRTIEEMDSTSLYKLSSILIVYCRSSKHHFKEVVEKINDVVRFAAKKSDQTKVMLKAILCAANLLSNDQVMTELLAASLIIFNMVADAFDRWKSSDSMRARDTLTDILLCYFDEIVKLAGVKFGSIGSCKLIPSKTVTLFNKFIDRELLALIKSLGELVQVIKSNFSIFMDTSYHHGYSVLLTNIFDYFLPFVKAKYIQKSNQMDLTEIAVNLTYLSLFKNTTEFSSLLHYFACNPKAECNQMERFFQLLIGKTDENFHSILVKEIMDSLPKLMEKYLLEPDKNQAAIKTALKKFIPFINDNSSDANEDYFLPKLLEFIEKKITPPHHKLFRLLDIFITTLSLEFKRNLFSMIAKRIFEWRSVKKKGVEEFHEAFKRFCQSHV